MSHDISMTQVRLMKKFTIEEKFTGYANITIEAETEEQALALYNRGHYSDYDYDMDDLFYDHTFVSIREKKQNQLTTIKEHNGKTYIQQ